MWTWLLLERPGKVWWQKFFLKEASDNCIIFMGSLLNKHFSSNSQSSDKGDSCLTLTEDAQSEQVSQSIWYEYSSKNDSFYHDNELAFFSSTIISMNTTINNLAS